MLAVHRAHHAVGGDDLHGGECVAGEPPRPGEHPDAAAQSQSGDADRGAGARGNPHPRGGELPVGVDQQRSCADSRSVALDPQCLVDADDVEPGYVDDQRRRYASTRGAPGGPPRVAVAAGAQGEGHLVGLGESEGGGHIVGARDLSDSERCRGVEAWVVDLGRCGVAGVVRPEESSLDLRRQGGEIRWPGGRWGRGAGRSGSRGHRRRGRAFGAGGERGRSGRRQEPASRDFCPHPSSVPHPLGYESAWPPIGERADPGQQHHGRQAHPHAPRLAIMAVGRQVRDGVLSELLPVRTPLDVDS